MGHTVDVIGAARTGIRLSPGATIWGVQENDVPALYTALIKELAPLELAYLHLEVTTDEATIRTLRDLWPGTLIINPGPVTGPGQTRPADADYWLKQGADLISFGRAFIANPDLVERLRTGRPLAAADEATYFEGGNHGYLTYPTYQYTAA